MLLEEKTAVVHGGGGAIGARAFAREGAVAASDRARTMTAATVNISCDTRLD
jgi:hypothetical protein